LLEEEDLSSDCFHVVQVSWLLVGFGGVRESLRCRGAGGVWSFRTNWVVFEHAHGCCDSGTCEGVEVAGLGHGKEAHEDDAGLDWIAENLLVGKSMGGREIEGGGYLSLPSLRFCDCCACLCVLDENVRDWRC